MATEVGGTLVELYFGSPERLADGYSGGSGAREKQSRTRRRGGSGGRRGQEGAGPDAAAGVSLVEAAVGDAVGVGEP